MADYNSIDIADFLKVQLNIEENSNSDEANKELLQLFSLKCKTLQVQPTIENLIEYLRVYRKDSTVPDIDFSGMQIGIEPLLRKQFNLKDTISY